MKYYISPSNDATYNLALEEYLLKDQQEEVLYLWVNNPTIVVGRNQNTLAEINEEEVRRRSITVVRRDTGGGAVYQDLGNLNFSLVINWDATKDYQFSEFLEPVILALEKFGIRASVEGRNDLLIGGKKVSGNAQTIYKKHLLHHGTLLFNEDLAVIGKVLEVSKGKLEAQGIKSVRARVGNILDFAPNKFTMEEFQQAIIQSYCKEDSQLLQLSTESEAKIRKWQKEKYQSWDYVYGQSAEANYKAGEKLSCGTVVLELLVDQSVIRKIHFSGDFLCMRDITGLEDHLIGVKYNYDCICQALVKAKVNSYFNQIEVEELARLFFPRS